MLEQLGMEGVLVLEVPAGTPAAAAGLRPTYRDVFGDLVLGDIIVGESKLSRDDSSCQTVSLTVVNDNKPLGRYGAPPAPTPDRCTLFCRVTYKRPTHMHMFPRLVLLSVNTSSVDE